MAQQTGYGIQDFYQTVVTRGLARTNLFRIKSIDGVFNSENTDLLIFAQGGMIPARNISTAKVSFKAFDFNVPMVANYPENQGWAVNFFCDSQYVLRDILESWSRKIFDEHKQISTFNLKDIEVVLLNNSFGAGSGESRKIGEMQEIRSYLLKGCFPVSIGAMSYSVGNGGELTSIPLSIAFQYVISDNSL